MLAAGGSGVWRNGGCGGPARDTGGEGQTAIHEGRASARWPSQGGESDRHVAEALYTRPESPVGDRPETWTMTQQGAAATLSSPGDDWADTEWELDAVPRRAGGHAGGFRASRAWEAAPRGTIGATASQAEGYLANRAWEAHGSAAGASERPPVSSQAVQHEEPRPPTFMSVVLCARSPARRWPVDSEDLAGEVAAQLGFGEVGRMGELRMPSSGLRVNP